jgi:hypothetical protein
MATATKTKRKSKTKAPTVSIVISTFSGANGIKFKTPRIGPIDKYIPITDEDYILDYGTPLRDAAAKFIGNLEALRKPGTVVIGCLADESLSMSGNEHAVIDGLNEFVDGMKDVEVDPDSNGKVLCVIFTDGQELHSTEVSSSELSNIITNKEDEGWTFIYLGANQDAWLTGASYGLSGTARGQTVNFVANSRGTTSALRYAGAQATSYLSSQESYSNLASENSVGTITETGEWEGKK